MHRIDPVGLDFDRQQDVRHDRVVRPISDQPGIAEHRQLPRIARVGDQDMQRSARLPDRPVLDRGLGRRLGQCRGGEQEDEHEGRAPASPSLLRLDRTQTLARLAGKGAERSEAGEGECTGCAESNVCRRTHPHPARSRSTPSPAKRARVCMACDHRHPGRSSASTICPPPRSIGRGRWTASRVKGCGQVAGSPACRCRPGRNRAAPRDPAEGIAANSALV